MRYTMHLKAGVLARESINLEPQEMVIKQTGKHKQSETTGGERGTERSWQ